MQAVEEGDEIVVAARIIARQRHFEVRVGGDPVLFGVDAGLIDRTRMEVVAGECRVRESLGHEDGREPMSASDVDDLCAPLELLDHAVDRRQPGRNEICLIPRPEKAPNGAKEAERLIAPADALSRPKCRLNQRLILHQRDRSVEGALEINRTVGIGEHHRLLGRQSKLPGR
jgi:hypothetical protein